MVREYAVDYYFPAQEKYTSLVEPDINRGIQFADWLENTRKKWKAVQVVSVNVAESDLKVGADVEVQAVVKLGELTPDDVTVQLYSGPLTSRGDIINGQASGMQVAEEKNGTYIFKGNLKYKTSGERGLSVRVLPRHDDLVNPFMTNLITWANGQ
jgi:starch phosphorylase